MVQVTIEPTNEEVIGKRQDPGSTNGIVGTDISHDGNLGSETNVGSEELLEERREGTTSGPFAEGVEQEFVTAVSVFLPSGKLVVDSERDTFFETVAGVGAKSDNVTCDLQTERHVEIFGDVGLGPELLVTIFVFVRNFLNGSPSQDCIVADEGRHVTICDGVANGGVDEVGEEGDTANS